MFLDATALFGHYSSTQCGPMSLQLHTENNQRSEGLGTVQGIVYHWTADRYNSCWDGYHFNVVYDPDNKAAYVVQSVKMSHKGQHIWGRNTGLVGISLCAMLDETIPVMDAQIEQAAMLGAEICAWKSLNPRGEITVDKKTSNNTTIWSTGGTMQAPVIADHAWYAKTDSYFPERWDISTHYGPMLFKTQAHYDKLKSGEAKFLFKDLLVG